MLVNVETHAQDSSLFPFPLVEYEFKKATR